MDEFNRYSARRGDYNSPADYPWPTGDGQKRLR
ncbi:hypothetical protein [Rahnella sp. CJA17(1/100)]|nr:hypothetical protein [Rahnella sp. CJA17(1/100)]